MKSELLPIEIEFMLEFMKEYLENTDNMSLEFAERVQNEYVLTYYQVLAKLEAMLNN